MFRIAFPRVVRKARPAAAMYASVKDAFTAVSSRLRLFAASLQRQERRESAHPA